MRSSVNGQITEKGDLFEIIPNLIKKIENEKKERA